MHVLHFNSVPERKKAFDKINIFKKKENDNASKKCYVPTK